MKKILVLCSLIVALGFAVAGCCGGDCKPSPSESASDAADTTQPVDPHAGHNHGDDSASGGQKASE